jgi:hypothetical protein
MNLNTPVTPKLTSRCLEDVKPEKKAKNTDSPERNQGS